jgi:hypothetical protein
MAVTEMTFSVKHLTSKANAVADYLSRYPPPAGSGDDCIDQLMDRLHIITQDHYEPWLQELYNYLTNPGYSASSKIKKHPSDATFDLHWSRIAYLISFN